jgi:hypothetical protein
MNSVEHSNEKEQENSRPNVGCQKIDCNSNQEFASSSVNFETEQNAQSFKMI